jgi:hypothetical protein
MKRFSLRLPDDLHEALRFSAQREHRSMHNQILMLLESYAQQIEFQAGDVTMVQTEVAEQAGDTVSPRSEPGEPLMIMDGTRDQEINLIEQPTQTFAVFGRQNRYFLQILTWNPSSSESQREFRALAEAGYHIRSRF